MILNGAVIYPLALHFPTLPANFMDSSYPQLAYTTVAPGVTAADYGTGEIVAVAPDATKPLYSGYWPTGTPNTYTAMIASTTPDGLANFQPHFDRPVQPGQTDTFTVSLRFAPTGTAGYAVGADAYRSFANTFPSQLQWTDRRPFGTVYLASSPQTGAANQPGGFPSNPRRYFNDGNPSDFDVRTAAGLQQFQNRVLQQARANVTNLIALGAQGVVTWDLEGQQYPHATSYVCSPNQIAQVAPEMDSVVTDSGSPYRGMKLDDAYFKTMTDAGFRVGVCVRPQHFAIAADGTATQTTLNSTTDVKAELAGKIAFAHDRWGARLFYVDSSVDAFGGALDPGIFQQLQQQFPDSLLMPEEYTPRHYAYTAPLQNFINHGDTGTDPAVRALYPGAFSPILINDVAAAALAAAVPKLTTSVRAGDVLMGHVDYPDPNNIVIAAIDTAAGVTAPTTTTPVTTTPPTTTTPVTTTPVTTTPVTTTPPTTTTPTTTVPSSAAVTILSPSTGATLSGAATVTAALNVNLDAAGSYLMVDGREFGTQRVTGPPYNYALDTTTLSNGAHTLQLWAHDTANTVQLSGTVPVTVANSTTPVTTTPVTTTPVTTTPVTTTPTTTAPTGPVAVTYPVTGQAISGTVQVSAAIIAQLDAAGSYLLVDGAQFGYTRASSPPFVYPLDSTVLAAGSHIVQVWAHTTGNATIVSDPITVIVRN